MDCKGKWIFGYSFYFEHGTSFMAELRSLLIGLRICRRTCLTPQQVELDSKVLVDLLIHRKQPPWHALYWWQELQELRHFFSPSIIHTYREGNSLADCLANEAIAQQHNQLFFAEADLPLSVRYERTTTLASVLDLLVIDI